MSSIDTFKSKFKDGPLIPNRYEVVFEDAPVSVQDAINSKDISFMCSSLELPSRNLASAEQKMYGPLRKIPYTSTFVDTTMTFLLSQKAMIEKRFFDSWQETINDINTFDSSYYDDSVCNVQVNILSEYDNSQLYSIKLLEVWPMNVGALTFSYDTKDTPATLTVTFAYRKWIKNEKGPRTGSLTAVSGTGSVSGSPSVLHTMNDNMAR